MGVCREFIETGWCGLCYSGRRGRQSYKGHSHYRASAPFFSGGDRVALVKPSGSAASPTSPAAEGEPGPLLLLPALREHLCDTQWADGSPRQTSTLLIFAEDGCWKCCLTDRASERSTWVSARTLGGLFQSLGERLQSDTAEWRRRPPQGPRRGR